MSSPTDPVHGVSRLASQCVDVPKGTSIIEHEWGLTQRRFAAWIDPGWESANHPRATLRLETSTGGALLAQEYELKSRGICINVPAGVRINAYVRFLELAAAPPIDPNVKVYASIAPGSARTHYAYGGQLNNSSVAAVTQVFAPDLGTPEVQTADGRELGGRFSTGIRLTLIGTPGAAFATWTDAAGVLTLNQPGVFFLSIDQQATLTVNPNVLASWQWEVFA